MGKKRIFQKTTDELLKETAKQEKAQKKVAAAITDVPSVKVKNSEGVAYIKVTYNNTIISLTDAVGNLLAWSSAGSLGFKGPKKSTPFAASKVAETVLVKVKSLGLTKIKIFVRGIGSGRESAVRALANAGMEILLIKDVTPVPHNGCRPPKPRRV